MKTTGEHKSGISKFSGDFNRGYTRAVQDMIDIFEHANRDLKYYYKSMTYKWAIKLLKCCLENRMKLCDEWRLS